MIAAIYARKRLAAVLLGASLLASCTTHGRIGSPLTAPVPSDAAEIVVIRESRFAGSALTMSATIDGAPRYGINGPRSDPLGTPGVNAPDELHEPSAIQFGLPQTRAGDV